MASFFSSLLSAFSGKEKSAPAAKGAEPVPYKDCLIYPAPMPEGGQYRLAGRIEKEVDGETLVRHIIRADMFSSMDDDRPEWCFPVFRRREVPLCLTRHLGRSTYGDLTHPDTHSKLKPVT
jgi:hypothetical protein